MQDIVNKHLENIQWSAAAIRDNKKPVEAVAIAPGRLRVSWYLQGEKTILTCFNGEETYTFTNPDNPFFMGINDDDTHKPWTARVNIDGHDVGQDTVTIKPRVESTPEESDTSDPETDNSSNPVKDVSFKSVATRMNGYTGVVGITGDPGAPPSMDPDDWTVLPDRFLGPSTVLPADVLPGNSYGPRCVPADVFLTDTGPAILYGTKPIPHLRGPGSQCGCIAASNGIDYWRDYTPGNPVLWQLQPWQKSKSRIMPMALCHNGSEYIVYYVHEDNTNQTPEYSGMRYVGMASSKDMRGPWKYVEQGPVLTIDDFIREYPDLIDQDPDNNLKRYGRIYPSKALYYKNEYWISVAATTFAKSITDHQDVRLWFHAANKNGPWKGITYDPDNFQQAQRHVVQVDNKFYSVAGSKKTGLRGMKIGVSDSLTGRYEYSDHLFTGAGENPQGQGRLFQDNGVWVILFFETINPDKPIIKQQRVLRIAVQV